MLLTNFFYLVIYMTFLFGMIPLVSVLLGSASASFFWECLGGLMLYSMEASLCWSSDTSACGWQMRCVEIFWRSIVKVDQWCYLCVLFLFRGFRQSMMLSLRLISFSRFSAWILLFSYDIVICFSHLLSKSDSYLPKKIVLFASLKTL